MAKRKVGKRETVRAPAKAAPRRMGRRLLLDQAVIGEISAAVERGAFLHVAAESAGVSRRTLQGWLERGRDLEDRADSGETLDERESLFVELLDAVRQAHASARLRAEGAVLYENPLAWLRFGPGRDRGPEDPGWTVAVREVPPEVKSAAEQMLAEALRQLGLGSEPVTVTSTVEPVLALGSAGTEDCGEEGDG